VQLLRRLFTQFFIELRGATTPEIIFTIVFALAAFLSKYFFAGGVTLEDWSSLLIPSLWAGCGICGFYLIQAARCLHADDISAWEAWKPAIPEAESLRAEKPTPKRIIVITAVPCLCLAVIFIVTLLVPHLATRAQVIAELTKLAQSDRWDLIAKQLPTIESDPKLHDVGLYFRGMLYEDAIEKGSPVPEPERYLSQVPQDSEFFSDAQRLRLRYFEVTHSTQLKAAIIDTLDRANLHNPVYFTLRLQPPPALSYREITALHGELVERYSNVFDFGQMTPYIRGRKGVYLSIDLNDLEQIPACVLLFLLRELQTSRFECLNEPQQTISDSYDNLTKRISDAEFVMTLRHFGIDPNTRRDFEQLRGQPFPYKCNSNRPKNSAH
jgi:hypothetical protein